MAKTITNTQKKELAKILYTKENLTQAEIAERVGASRVTVGKWINTENWAVLKVSITLTKEQEIKNFYQQMVELNEVIMNREKGSRFPDTKEASILSIIGSTIKSLETEIGLSDIINTFSEFLKWLRTFDIEKAKEIAPILDAFVQSKVK